jgi:hypothetical protein
MSAVIVAAAFALLAALVVWNVQRSMNARFFIVPEGNDVWFEADLSTVADTVLHRWTVQSCNARHRLLPRLATGSADGLSDSTVHELRGAD